ncbi:MAG: glycosyltransferase family 4 protein [Lachnospiraceae bacterium]|nr:glycosyltransferase family 4 protein [Lachnospiraceae bacterium]
MGNNIVSIRGKEQFGYIDVIQVLNENEKMIKMALDSLDDELSRILVNRFLDKIKEGQFIASDREIKTSMTELEKRLEKTGENFNIRASSVLSDLWEIPLFVCAFFPSCVIRAVEDEDGSVLYCILWPHTKKEKNTKIKTVTAISGALYSFTNVDLVKAFGMIPYLFHTEFGCEVTAVSYRGNETYPYLSLLPGLKLELIENNPPEGMLNYIHEHASRIDLLVLQGAYEYNHNIVVEYKRINPNGKIFMNLDQNSEWMDRIKWDDPDYLEMMNFVDVKGSTCKSMQDHLNEKWPWHIDCIRQGYYNVFGFDDNIDEILKNKEKVILCVARHGTWQKATEILMEAFAAIADDIPEWKLELVGSIEEDFREYIDGYLFKYPKLSEKVIFFGNILDREELHSHFKRASIFTLTSRIEGGTPNVISEALYTGCAIAVTQFDAYLDATGPLDDEDRICGMSSPVDDLEGYKGILKELCNSMDLVDYQRNARWRGEKYFDSIKIERELYGKLCNP